MKISVGQALLILIDKNKDNSEKSNDQSRDFSNYFFNISSFDYKSDSSDGNLVKSKRKREIPDEGKPPKNMKL